MHIDDIRLCTHQSGTEKRLNTQHRFLVFVWFAPPKEAFQPISSMAQHQVNMQVRDVSF